MGHLESWRATFLQVHLHAGCNFNNLWDPALSCSLLVCNRFDKTIESISYSQLISCGDMAKFVSNRCHTPCSIIDHYLFKRIDAGTPGPGLLTQLAMSWADLAILPGDGKAGYEDACVGVVGTSNRKLPVKAL